MGSGVDSNKLEAISLGKVGSGYPVPADYFPSVWAHWWPRLRFFREGGNVGFKILATNF